MTRRILDEGGPVTATADGDRIGIGPWARWLASAVVPDESAQRAERGRRLARQGAVSRVTIEAGAIGARVEGSTGNQYDVALSVPTIPQKAWAETTRAVRGQQGFEGATGNTQSVHLAHFMATRFGVQLAPSARDVRRSCTCPDAEFSGGCKHVAAVAFAVAEAIDREPSLFLLWRGCSPIEPPAAPADPWQSGALPVPRPPRALPPGAVLKRLGRSGIRVGAADLTDALGPAYDAFAATRSDRA